MRRLLALASLAFAFSASAQLGSITFPNSGKLEAQASFLRGVAALHSFWYDEAADAFREAERIDPRFALAYWGEAMTYNHPIWMEVDVDAGRKALAKYQGSIADPRERAWFDAVKTLYGDGDKPARDAAYEAAMEKLAKAHPEDVEAQVFWALSILALHPQGDRNVREQIRAAAILEPIFATHPEHPGVLHYLIHAYDDPIHAPLGLRAAQRYARVAPAAFHAQHMPAHIFLQLGMWPETIASNERAYAVSKSWVESKGLPRAKRDLHSLQWLQYAYLQSGRVDDARKLFAEAEGDDPREKTARANMQARFAIETGDWSVLPKELPSDDHAPVVFAMALAALARNDSAALAAARARLSSGKTEHSAIGVMIAELDALAERDTARALDLAAKAAALEDGLGSPSGPADTFKPAHELYGELLLKSGKKAEGREQFRLALLRQPNRRLSMKGAAQAE